MWIGAVSSYHGRFHCCNETSKECTDLLHRRHHQGDVIMETQFVDFRTGEERTMKDTKKGGKEMLPRIPWLSEMSTSLLQYKWMFCRDNMQINWSMKRARTTKLLQTTWDATLEHYATNMRQLADTFSIKYGKLTTKHSTTSYVSHSMQMRRISLTD